MGAGRIAAAAGGRTGVKGMSEDEARQAERTTIEEARRRGGAGGVEPDAPSFADDTGTTDLGVNEPVVSERDRGKSWRGGERSPD